MRPQGGHETRKWITDSDKAQRQTKIISILCVYVHHKMNQSTAEHNKGPVNKTYSTTGIFIIIMKTVHQQSFHFLHWQFLIGWIFLHPTFYNVPLNIV